MILASVVSVVGRWVPRHESSQLSSIAMSGTGPGTAFVYCVSAGTSHVQVIGGWPFNFIILSVLLLVFSCVWGVWVTDSPETNTRISAEERAYIQKNMSSTVNVKKSVPWLKILTSPPVFAVAVAQLGSDWMVYCMITVIPSYFKHVRNMETHKVDMLCGLPWLATPILGYLVSRVVDFLRKRGVPTNLLRKTADAIAKPVGASLLLTMSYLPDDKHSQPWVMLLYGLPVLLLNGFVSSSHNANVVEMSPEYAGVVYGLSQTVAMTSAFIAPVLVEAITPHDSPQEWRNCFAVIFGVSVVTFLIYALLGSSEPQDWGPPDPETQRLTEGKVALRY